MHFEQKQIIHIFLLSLVVQHCRGKRVTDADSYSPRWPIMAPGICGLVRFVLLVSAKRVDPIALLSTIWALGIPHRRGTAPSRHDTAFLANDSRAYKNDDFSTLQVERKCCPIGHGC